MRITLIQAPQMLTLTNYLTTVAIPPLGLAYIGASLREVGHTVSFVDGVGEGIDRSTPFGEYFLRGLPHEEIVSRVDPDAQLIGLGCMFTPQWPSVRALVRRLREAFPNAIIVLGGEHPTGLPELALSTSAADFVVLSEGEETIVALAAAIETGESIASLPGIAYIRDGVYHSNPRRPRIRNIDDIAWPAWDLVPIEKYIQYNQPHGAPLGRSMPMLATRGCPYQCTYCSSPQMWTTTWVARDPADVVDEIQHNMKVYKANDFHFEDLTAIVRRTWIIDFCKVIVDRGLGNQMTWQLPSGTRSEAIDLEVMTWMKQAGCRVLSYAPESGSKRLLKIIKKKINLDNMLNAAKAAVKVNMSLQANFVLGHPEETFSDLLKTYWLLVRCAWVGFTEVHAAAFYPLPNTEDYEKLRKEGRIPEVGEAYFMTIFQCADPLRPVSWNVRFSDRTLRAMILFAYALFFGCSWLFRPWRLVRTLSHLTTGKAKNKFERIALESVRKVRILKAGRDAPNASR